MIADVNLEAHTVGAALLGQGLDGLQPEAFTDPRWRAVWTALLDEPLLPDLAIVAAKVDGGIDLLLDAQTAVPVISGQERRCDQLRALHHRRRIQAWTAELNQAAAEGIGYDQLLAHPPLIDSGLTAEELTAEPVEQYRARPAGERPDWVIPGILRRGWRALVVAREGVGKAVLLRQLAVAASQGIHPFTAEPILPIRTLYVDLENPADVIDDQLALVTRPLRGEWKPGQAWQWRRPQGINLREHRWQTVLDRVIAQAAPDLLCLGPLYKAFRQRAGEQWEEVAVEVCNALDDLRVRHGFALVIEHHAAKGERTARGSAVWLGWPEFGFFLDVEHATPEGQVTDVKLSRFRSDRSEATWPIKLHRGREWPWEPVYPTGTF